MGTNSKHYNARLITGLAVLLIVAFAVSLYMGSAEISIKEVINSAKSGDIRNTSYRIFMFIRLPRSLAALFAGVALAVSGVIIQVVLSNPLASPNIIGVNSGAGFFALLAMIFMPSQPEMIPFMAFLGALATSMIIYLLSLKFGARRITIVLAGIAIGGILSAGTDLLLTMFPQSIIGSKSFMVGGFSGITLKSLFPAGYYILAGLIVALILSYEMNLLLLGGETAKSLGVRVGVIRLVLIAVASILAGAAVSFSGLLGFIGLVVPHLGRMLVGNNNKVLIPISALLGGSFVIICDTICRVMFAPYEIPVGIVMSFLGGPFFIYFLFKRRRSYD
ncbi:MAG TPA: iron ABC transporter permease [Clostridiales bacterium]|nr:iron ABC transporter permease [Clostridiales bacterium]